MSKFLLVTLSIFIGIIIVFLFVSFVANRLFNHRVTQEVQALFSGYKAHSGRIVTQEDLVGLPQNVQKWLEYSQVIGKEIHTVRLKQKAEMRTKPDQPWLATQAEQYFSADKPGFIWNAKIQFAPLIHLVGRDKYVDGNGHMLIKLMSLFAVADAKGPEINQGTLLRYLVETVWFPTAALNDFITWEEINTESAKAIISYGGVTASGVFTFNELGEVISFEGERYMEQDGKYSLESWLTPMGNYKEFDGIRIPSSGEIIWRLDTGDFNWFHWEIEDVEYNNPNIY